MNTSQILWNHRLIKNQLNLDSLPDLANHQYEVIRNYTDCEIAQQQQMRTIFRLQALVYAGQAFCYLFLIYWFAILALVGIALFCIFICWNRLSPLERVCDRLADWIYDEFYLRIPPSVWWLIDRLPSVVRSNISIFEPILYSFILLFHL